MRDGKPISFGELIQTATETRPTGELEWFLQLRAALKNGQVEDAIRAIDKAIEHKKRVKR